MQAIKNDGVVSSFFTYTGPSDDNPWDEIGIAFSNYVSKTKAEEAANLLTFSEYTDSEISNLLGFSSQSYFIKIFKKYLGVTPKEYKKRYKFPDFVKENK